MSNWIASHNNTSDECGHVHRLLSAAQRCARRCGSAYSIHDAACNSRITGRSPVPCNCAEHVWTVYEGRPSWHQQRAGHIAACSSVYHSSQEAEEYTARVLDRHPDRHVFVVHERRLLA